MKVVVLLSGGLDSGVMTAFLKRDILPATCKIYALSFDYGQRHNKELDCARKLAKKLHINHKIVQIPQLKELLVSSLTGHGEIPTGEYDEKTQRSTTVPNRNMILLSMAAGYAQSIGASHLFYAAHTNDTRVYPDCRLEFVKALDTAIYLATIDQPVELHAPFKSWTKADIVAWGLEHNFPFELTWSCYMGKEKACGRCGTCRERLEAFKANGAKDPIKYEVSI